MEAPDMPLINYVKLYGAEVAKVLDRDERLIEMGLYREPLLGDESRLERTTDELSGGPRGPVDERDRSGGTDKFVQGFDPLAGGLQVNPRRIDRALGGLSGVGGAASLAGRMWRAGRHHDGSAYYAVTERRLLLLGTTRPGAGDYHILVEVPRAEVASAARRGKLLFQRGRVEVRFTDGSMKAWTTATLSTGRARSLVAALS
jgi:hypothetical protein